MSNLGKRDEAKYFSVTDYKPIITCELIIIHSSLIHFLVIFAVIVTKLMKLSNIDAGDIELFKNIEATLSQALPQEPTEWRRSFARDVKAIKLSAIFEPFSESILQHENHFHFLKQPILHVFWTQCAVSIPLKYSVDLCQTNV